MRFTVSYVWASYMRDLERSERELTEPRPVPPPMGCTYKKDQEKYDEAYYTLLPLAKSEYKRINDFYKKRSTQRWLTKKPK